MREGLWATVWGVAEGKVGVSGTVHPQPGEVWAAPGLYLITRQWPRVGAYVPKCPSSR